MLYQAIKLSDKKEKQGFKRSRNLEKKLQDPEKLPATPATVGFQPFAASHPDDEERVEREERVSNQAFFHYIVTTDKKRHSQ